MAQAVETEQKRENAVPESSFDLVYGLNDRPPFWESLFVALQHVFAVFVPIVTPPLFVCQALGVDATYTSYIVGMSLLISGWSTFLQGKTFGPLGSGLLSIQGTSFSFIGPIIAVGTASLDRGESIETALGTALGVCLFGAAVEIILSRFLGVARKIFTPLVTGTVVLLVGLNLIKVGITSMGGGPEALENGTFGNLPDLGLSLLVLTIIVICSMSKNQYLRMGSIVIGLLAGYIVALLLGRVSFSGLGDLPIINVPIPFRFGLGIDYGGLIPMAVIYVASMLESIGDITATSMVTKEPIEGPKFTRRLKNGILGDGVNSSIAAVFSTFPNTTMSQNNGLIQLTGVGSRFIGYYVAVILAVLGLFPIVGGVLNTLPTSVLGGATILMFGAVAMAGINILLTVDFDRRSSMIVMLSICAGVGVAYYPEIAQNLPDAAKSVLSSGIATGALMALFLNLVLPQEEATLESADLTDPENANL